MAFYCLTVIICIIIGVMVSGSNINDATSDIPTKYIQVNNINGLSFKDRAKIFEPTHYLSSKRAQHNVHVFDNFGKFIKLKYNSKHGDHINIFELTENFKNNIKSVQCMNDTKNTIKIRFNDQNAVNKYDKNIKNHLNSDKGKNEFFVTGSSFWKCYNKKERKYTPILRKIITSKISNNMTHHKLLLTTEYAKYTDLFENLEMKLETNANMHQSQIQSQIQPRRKLLSSCNGDLKGSSSSLWDSIMNSITAFISSVRSLVSEISDFVETVENIYQDATELMDTLSSGDYSADIDSELASWEYNYYTERSIELSSSVTCKSCYAYADLTYTLKIDIYNYKLAYFYLKADGRVELNIDIEANDKYEDEFSVKTCKLGIPDLGFSIVGIHFGFSIYGEFAVGIDFNSAVKYTFKAEGTLTRGVEYDAATNKQNYFGKHDFHKHIVGPILEFDSSKISIYARATLYLVLSLVGNVYIGIQPKHTIYLTDNSHYGSGESCAIYYTPSAEVTVFVGASIDLADSWNVWSKDIWTATYALPDYVAGSSGCITYEEITELNEWAKDEEECNWFCWRRRMLIDSNTELTQFMINYTSPKTVYDFEYQWGKLNTMWHANLTTLNKTCYDWYHSYYNLDSIPFNAALPSYGHLIIYPQDNNGSILYGIYKTVNPISSNDGYLITTNVTCISRYIFTKVIDHDDQLSTIHHRFNVSLMDNDYHCDVNETAFLANNDLEIDEWHIQTQLPKQMDAILMDSAFGTIILSDIDNCHIFALTKDKGLYDFNTYFVDKLTQTDGENISYKLPSQTWFGTFHCDYNDEGDDNDDNDDLHISDAMTLYFHSVDWLNGHLNATLLFNDNQTVKAVGTVNFDDLTLDFNVFNSYNGKFVLNMHGFITVLEDGSLLYFGVIPSDTHKCTGFIFQGMINMEQFNEDKEQIMVSNDSDCSDKDNTSIAVIFVFVGLGIAAFLLSTFYLLIKCNGYSLSISKLNHMQNSYQLMNDNNL